ncbi:hypothetical protein PCYB_074190 [Plasmodium cynomolgi strain B]|uniref:Uncharacterized protein n=1 Tax=Plasmodium cynomolgi (strain B) TaxID=1120755 RepID=K6UJG0_PLACD|nr:hypothetical protein PCYB_074190 [Plasmodium cynomolgi strain B]GAB65918.1 hypothetical protein PCYB_074190 [Plasmodium cynomolgi strain B]
MKPICSTAYAVKLLEFFPWMDDVLKLMYLNRSWKRVILDVINNTNFLRGKKIMRLKNRRSIFLILNELIIGSCNPNPLFFNYIQNSFPRLMCFKLIITSPVCIPLLKNFCFNSKHLRYIIICIVNRQLVTDYREKLEKNLSNFFRQWGINVTLITELGA